MGKGGRGGMEPQIGTAAVNKSMQPSQAPQKMGAPQRNTRDPGMSRGGGISSGRRVQQPAQRYRGMPSGSRGMPMQQPQQQPFTNPYGMGGPSIPWQYLMNLWR